MSEIILGFLFSWWALCTLTACYITSNVTGRLSALDVIFSVCMAWIVIPVCFVIGKSAKLEQKIMYLEQITLWKRK